MRARMRRLRFGLSTLLGGTPRGFFIPYRYADQVPRRSSRAGYPNLEPIFRTAEPRFQDLLRRVDHHAAALQAIGGEAPPQPRWNQDWFPRLDAAAAYVLVRELKPKRIAEVGSGHSTRFLVRAARDEGITVDITAIDPAPRADIAGLPVRTVRQTVQAAGTAPFDSLRAGDMLFIDSSHILMPGTDVDWLLNQVLPSLPAGILVHVHDIFLPDEYPASWEWRGYNEQVAVGSLLQGGGFELVWASRYAATRMAERVAASAALRLPLISDAFESSLWLRKF